jgi:hypothetical protein
MKTKILSLLVMVCIVLFSCKKEKEKTTSEKLIGSWLTVRGGGNAKTAQNMLYDFDKNGNYTGKMFYTDVATGNVLGFSSKTIGKYRVNEDKLELYNSTSYGGENDGLVAEDKLSKVKISNPAGVSYTITFEEARSLFIYYGDCPNPAYTSCLVSDRFLKQ